MEDTVAEWVRIARRDARLARIALDAGDPENALYLCQQALEKALKAHIQQSQTGLPPKIHSLPRLGEIAGLWAEMTEAQRDLLLDVDAYSIAGRYGALAGEGVAPPGADEARDALAGTEEVLGWLFGGIR
jgi:HEPN domain-containing protein